METFQRNANRGSISTSYDIDNSLKLDSTNSEYLYKTRDASGSDWNRLKWTASMWVKHIPSESSSTSPKERMFGAADSNNDFDIRFRGQPIGFRNNSDVDGVAELRTTAVYRDYSAWYHIVAVWDTANGTAGNRMRLYVNGEEVTDFSTDTQPSQNEKSIWGKKNDGTDGNVTHTIGAYYNYYSGFAQGFNGYMAEIHWVEGEALAPSDFGRTDSNGVWVPKEYTGSHGTNGFYLDFSNSSSLGADASGNGNNWSLNNISAQDQAQDTPTNNFCTMNPNSRTNGNIKTQEGGTRVSTDGGSGFCSMLATMAVGAGKWYWEAKYHDHSGDTNTVYVGVAPTNDPYIPQRQGGYYLGNVETAGSMGWYLNDGANKNQNGSWGNPSYGDKLMFALDMDNYKLYYGINGTWGNSANPANGTGSVTAMSTYWMSAIKDALTFVAPAVTVYQGNYMRSFNFGGVCTWNDDISTAQSDANGYGRFEYTPPTGFYALCSKNLAEYG